MKRSLMIMALVLVCSFGAVQHASAWSPFGYVCSGNGPGTQSSVCSNKGSGDPIAGPNGIIEKVTNLLAIVAGIAAVIIILVGGFRYITSGGEGSKVSSAKNTIINAMIGLAIIVVARTIVVFIISKL